MDMTSLLQAATEDSEPDARLAEFRTMALDLMSEHGLTDWTFRWDSARQRAGLCNRAKKELSFSGPLMSIWPVEHQRDTVLHEIAHALTTGGHDEEWRRECIRIGADPTRTWGHNGEERLELRWTGRCPYGHVIGHRDRRPSRLQSCARCAPQFDTRYPITWTRNF